MKFPPPLAAATFLFSFFAWIFYDFARFDVLLVDGSAIIGTYRWKIVEPFHVGGRECGQFIGSRTFLQQCGVAFQYRQVGLDVVCRFTNKGFCRE